MPQLYPVQELSLSKFGAIQQVQMQLNTALLNNLGKVGTFERRLRENFLNYIKKAVGEKKSAECFVFISSQRSINISSYVREYVVRTEKYNGKEIGLLHFGNEEMLSFKNKISDSVTFNFWSIIVNTDVPLIAEWKENIGLSDEVCLEECASRLLIELKWQNTTELFNKIKIHVSEKRINGVPALFDDKTRRNKMFHIIKGYFDMLFNSTKVLQDIVECMRNSFYNVFFSKIETVYDALAFQFLREKLFRGERIEIESVDFLEEIFYTDSSEMVGYRYRKMLVDVLANLAQERPSETVREVLVAIMQKEKFDVYEIYNSIISVCENINLKNIPLYKNTVEARRKL